MVGVSTAAHRQVGATVLIVIVGANALVVGVAASLLTSITTLRDAVQWGAQDDPLDTASLAIERRYCNPK